MFDHADLLNGLQQAIDVRRRREEDWRRRSQAADPVEIELRSRLAQLLSARDARNEDIRRRFDRALETVREQFDQQEREFNRAHADTIRQIETEAEAAIADVERKRGDSEWVVASVLDDNSDDSPVREFERIKTLLAKSQEEQAVELQSASAALESAAAECSRAVPSGFQFAPLELNREKLQEQFQAAAADARTQLRKLKSLWLPQLFSGWRTAITVVALTLAAAAPVYFGVDPAAFGLGAGRNSTEWMAVAGAAGLILGVLLGLVLFMAAAMRQSELVRHAAESLAEAGWIHQHWLRAAKDFLTSRKQWTEQQQRKIEQDRTGALRRYEQAHADRLNEIETRRATRLADERARFAAASAAIHSERQAQLRDIEEQHRQEVGESAGMADVEIPAAESRLQQHLSQSQRQRLELWSTLKGDWEAALRRVQEQREASQLDNRAKFPDWPELRPEQWRVPATIPAVLSLGEYHIDLAAWDDAVSDDMRLAPRSSAITLPAQFAFPESSSLLFVSPTAAARREALGGMQAVMLRMLTSIPPGKLRYTIIDPVGLGESFAGFMHLADYDELLVTSRIWTESNQIEARLADLTEHMENVLQKYLRNEFQTIEEYNASAGEVAEPYHILVIGDFPAKFSEIAARRLVSVINSGPRCGVYTLLNIDPGKPLPNNFELSDIAAAMTKLEWRGDAFHADNALSQWPIRIESPPPPDDFTRIVKMVGEASKDARLVQVSFDRVAPDPPQVWSRDSRHELVVPLGRAGATKLQELRLGKGTSQHMLVAGKTGSGKSTFLHILITNLSLFYSPEEVNFFLIDFKKGVEFKDYATQGLPHARVIAVESDREFGVSVLQNLDETLQRRGELFRRHGVQDIAAYRNETKLPLPRILLVVDEFQEFFVEDDRLSQSASLLLDRLVRQGRAFGMHVVLGSQTLGGAYSLARTTLGQVAVRVALQCSEADAHLILSEENTAARLLARPGEAIYNDANGLIEGNHPFQIAWISDAQRTEALRVMRDRLQRRGLEFPPPIVFEGNIPSDVTHNAGVSRLIDEHHQRKAAVERPVLWLGDAVEIGPPTSLTLQRQSGQNVLLVGQDPEGAQGLLAAAALVLAASSSPRDSDPSVRIWDGSHPGSPESEYWKLLAQTLPVNVPVIAPQEAAEQLRWLHAELVRREELGHSAGQPPLVAIIFNVARFRDLRKVDDDFGLGSFGGESEKPAEPGKLFADLLARGPAVGLHFLIWCDGYNNVDRWFSRQSLKELELRIAFQMNAGDSSNLIDSPAAARLGTHRALLYREETGTVTKFRPFGVPPPAWLEQVRTRMQHGPESNVALDLEEFSIL